MNNEAALAAPPPATESTEVVKPAEAPAQAPNPAKSAVKEPKAKKPAALPADEYKPEFRLTLLVKSSSGPDTYEVTHGTYLGEPHPHGWACTCPDYYYRHSAKGSHCKHIAGVLAQLKPEVAALIIGKTAS